MPRLLRVGLKIGLMTPRGVFTIFLFILHTLLRFLLQSYLVTTFRPAAKTFGKNGVGPWGKQPAISPDAEWIWVAGM
jgi:hypothetical protein